MSAAAARTTMWCAAVLAACALGGACAKTTEPPHGGESNTNWLRVCTPDDDCGDGFSCVCGACTVACEDDLVCEGHGGGATCSALPASCSGGGAKTPASACLAECTRDADCSAVEDGVCRGGVCARRASAKCPSIEAGLQTPRPVSATYRRYDAITDMVVAVVDDSGLYFFDRTTALFVLPHGADEAAMLLPPRVTSARPFTITGMVTDGSNVYWGEAGQNIGPPDPGPPPPPGSLHAVAKTGGEPVTLAQSNDDIFIPLGVREDRVVVSGRGFGPSLVATDGSPREPLGYEIGDEYVRFMDGKLYWTVPWEGSSDEVGYFNDLFRADPLGDAAEPVTRIEGGEFRAGHGFVVWWQERTHLDPLVLDQNLVVLDERTGCAQPLPGVGLSVSTQMVMDDRHAYWHSFNGLGAVSSGVPLEGIPLLRADLRTGRLEQLVTEGYEALLTHDTIGQTADALFFNAAGTLVVIDKPR